MSSTVHTFQKTKQTWYICVYVFSCVHIEKLWLVVYEVVLL